MPVKNALTLPWSNGQVERQINKLKTIKRQMYGWAVLIFCVSASCSTPLNHPPKITKNHLQQESPCKQLCSNYYTPLIVLKHCVYLVENTMVFSPTHVVRPRHHTTANASTRTISDKRKQMLLKRVF